jgi:hypothetical protein
MISVLRAGLLSASVVLGAGNLAQAQLGAPAPSQVGPPLLPAFPRPPTQIPTLKPSAKPAFPKCGGATGVECMTTREKSRHRRLHKAN